MIFVLKEQVHELRNSPLRNKVNERLKEFESFSTKDSKEWFSELCFCILTANSKARTAIEIQNELGKEGFCTFPEDRIRDSIKRNKHRFHNNKARYIIQARSCLDVKSIMQKLVSEDGEKAAREWLVKNIKGISYKEASHFLRNVGYKNLAILDRHILNLMQDDSLLKRPKALTRKSYMKYEKIFQELAKQMDMSPAELDMYMWYLKGGDVLK